MLIGRILERRADGIVLQLVSGARMEIATVSIRRMQLGRGRIVAGEYWFADPNRTRLFFAPTARALGHDRGYLGALLTRLPVVLPSVAFGAGEHFTVSGGAPILFGQLAPVYVAPKITIFEYRNVATAIGGISVFSRNTGLTDSFGVGFAIATIGSNDNAFTGGIGYGYSGDEIAGRPAFMFGGEVRVARDMKVIAESYVLPGNSGTLAIAGVRLFGRRVSVDVGVMGARAGKDGTYCCLPMLNFVHAFER